MAHPATYDGLTSHAGSLFWLESSGERHVLKRWSPGASPSLAAPGDFDIDNEIHAYGGGAFAAAATGLWGVSGHDGRIWQLAPSGATPLTPPSADAYGDLIAADDHLLFVSEGHDGDQICAISTTTGTTRTLEHSPGFLAAPRPIGDKLAWLSWDLDEMPWDSTRLWVDSHIVAGGPDESVVEPCWGPDENLYFMSDRTGWLNLYRWDGRITFPVAPVEADCAAAPWELGYRSYVFLADGSIVVRIREGLRDRLMVVGSTGRQSVLDLPFTSIKPYLAALDDKIAVIAGTPTTAPAVVVVERDGSCSAVAGELPSDHAVRMPEERSLDELMFLLYPPIGAEDNWTAPLIVRAHPGPTDEASFRRDPQIDFFTRNGFAVADVDYRGSTGHGREFRRSLYGRWGLDDVADCRTVAENLLTLGTAIEGQVFIWGASAGGYTALHAVSQPGPFRAAAARSPIIDPRRWADSVPRFQRAHAVALSGGAGPVLADHITRPVLLIHGKRDAITSAQDTADLASGLHARGADHELMLLDTSSHTLAAPDLATTVLEAELAFFRRAIDSPRQG
ncbi:prolyl oligopeptidase family serine peptidase [Kribbella sp. NPDC026611]|uniref:S9 family peptidase n=1 Tax=Kribbella sp. NPDC026611 TaxID=3154911 RepID=UPI00340A5895